MAFLAGCSVAETDLAAGCVGSESADHAENEKASKDTIKIFFIINSDIVSIVLKIRQDADHMSLQNNHVVSWRFINAMAWSDSPRLHYFA
jgi:hypothetical protein